MTSRMAQLLLLHNSNKSCQILKQLTVANSKRDLLGHQVRKYSSGSYFHSVSSVPLSGLTLSQLLDRAVQKFPNNEAVVDCHQGIRKNYLEYRDDVDNFASGIVTLDLKKGDRIGIWSPNSYQYLVAKHASARLGLIAVSLNAFNQSREMDYCLRKSGCRVLISAESCRNIQYYGILQELLPELGSGKDFIRNEKYPNLERIVMISEKNFPGTLSFEAVAKSGGSNERSFLEVAKNGVQMHDPSSIYFTSGTTGVPSGALLSYHNTVNIGLVTCIRTKFDDSKANQRACAGSPLFHVLGGVFGSVCPLWSGHCLVLPSPMYSAQKMMESIDKERCTYIVGTPTMIIDILNHPDYKKYDLSSLNGGITGGSPVPIEVHKIWREKIKTNGLMAGFGMSETTGAACLLSPDDDPAVLETTVGRPYNHTEIKVIDAQGNVVPSNTPGEVLVRGFHTLIKYWEDDEKTQKAFTPDHWLKTGDIGKLDGNGYLRLVGRLSDLIIRGGENIYPSEVEDFISTNPKVAHVQAFGIPDSRLGEKLCAWILLKHDEKMTEEELKSFCNNRIASFKIPEHVKFVQEFPKLGTGKVDKIVMKQQMISDLKL